MNLNLLPYRAIALDLDGTLLTPQGELPQVTASVLRELASRGIEIVLASGRMAPRIFPIAAEIGVDMTIIAYNGAATLHGRIDHWIPQESCHINAATRDLVYQLCQKHGCFLNIYAKDQLYGFHPDAAYAPAKFYSDQTGAHYSNLYRSLDSLPQTEIAKLLVIDSAENRDKYFEEWLPIVSPFATMVKSNPEYLEFVRMGTSKGAALEIWLRKKNLKAESLLAFGDAENDFEMLSLAGEGIAMANATQGLRAKISNISKWSNQDNAVAKELIRIFNLSTLESMQL